MLLRVSVGNSYLFRRQTITTFACCCFEFMNLFVWTWSCNGVFPHGIDLGLFLMVCWRHSFSWFSSFPPLKDLSYLWLILVLFLNFTFHYQLVGRKSGKGDGPSECKGGILLTLNGARLQDLDCWPKLLELCFQQCLVPDTKRCGLGVSVWIGGVLMGLDPTNIQGDDKRTFSGLNNSLLLIFTRMIITEELSTRSQYKLSTEFLI